MQPTRKSPARKPSIAFMVGADATWLGAFGVLMVARILTGPGGSRHSMQVLCVVVAICIAASATMAGFLTRKGWVLRDSYKSRTRPAVCNYVVSYVSCVGAGFIAYHWASLYTSIAVVMITWTVLYAAIVPLITAALKRRTQK